MCVTLMLLFIGLLFFLFSFFFWFLVRPLYFGFGGVGIEFVLLIFLFACLLLPSEFFCLSSDFSIDGIVVISFLFFLISFLVLFLILFLFGLLLEMFDMFFDLLILSCGLGVSLAAWLLVGLGAEFVLFVVCDAFFALCEFLSCF